MKWIGKEKDIVEKLVEKLEKIEEEGKKRQAEIIEYKRKTIQIELKPSRHEYPKWMVSAYHERQIPVFKTFPNYDEAKKYFERLLEKYKKEVKKNESTN
ncbi:MAG: hypothetical protein J7L62_04080 [Candidatus Aminicenantes bacterium]|nr:hypothetical protein [Candidatus Aminicenantes bacterium]